MKKLTFSQKCYKLLKKIPDGKVTTYKWLAEKLNTKTYRAVGNAMNKNKNLMRIPCYKFKPSFCGIIFLQGCKKWADNKKLINKQITL